MTSTRTSKSTRSRFTLTMLGHAAAWQMEEAEALAARPADATAPCSQCGIVYASAGLTPTEEGSRLCKTCQKAGA